MASASSAKRAGHSASYGASRSGGYVCALTLETLEQMGRQRSTSTKHEDEHPIFRGLVLAMMTSVNQ
jgi:hypothetical protein